VVDTFKTQSPQSKEDLLGFANTGVGGKNES
jgi:hypothetical protein